MFDGACCGPGMANARHGGGPHPRQTMANHGAAMEHYGENHGYGEIHGSAMAHDGDSTALHGYGENHGAPWVWRWLSPWF